MQARGGGRGRLATRGSTARELFSRAEWAGGEKEGPSSPFLQTLPRLVYVASLVHSSGLPQCFFGRRKGRPFQSFKASAERVVVSNTRSLRHRPLNSLNKAGSYKVKAEDNLRTEPRPERKRVLVPAASVARQPTRHSGSDQLG